MSQLSFACRHQYGTGFELDVQFATSHRVTTLFGSSGSGKTSVLSMVAGFVTPAEGTIVQNQRILTDTRQGVNLRPEQRRMGFVFQDHLLFPHLTVEANLRYGARRQRHAAAPGDFSRVVTVLELGTLLQRSPANLSGGERQRVGIGRALLSRPELLLLDEPWAALDETLRDRILSYTERVVHEWNIPILFVSHDQGAVRRLAEWVIVLAQGRVVAAGKPSDVLSRPELLGSKDASGPVNLLRIDKPIHKEGHLIGQVGTQFVQISSVATHATGPLYVQFSPKEVMFSREDVVGISARNHLRGRILQFVELPHCVFVAVDVGQVIWGEVTRDAIIDLGLKVGMDVVCLVKTTSLEVVS